MIKQKILLYFYIDFDLFILKIHSKILLFNLKKLNLIKWCLKLKYLTLTSLNYVINIKIS